MKLEKFAGMDLFSYHVPSFPVSRLYYDNRIL